jgi:ABC-2 type transport system permease protein
VLNKTLRDLRWQVFWYGIGLGLTAALVVALYPSYAGQFEDFELPETLKKLFGMEDYTTPQGFVSTEFFSQTVPMLMTIFAIMQGTSALAGEEASGTLDLLLSQPISRLRLGIEKIGGFVVSSILVSIIVCPAWAISIPAVGVDLSIGRTVLATFSYLPLVWVFYAISLYAAAALPNRRLATGAVVLYAVATYIIYALAQTVDVLEPLRWLAPFNYYNGSEIIAKGPDVGGALALIGASVAFSLLALRAFERRDIGVRSEVQLPSFFRRGRSNAVAATSARFRPS